MAEEVDWFLYRFIKVKDSKLMIFQILLDICAQIIETDDVLQVTMALQFQ